MKRGIILIAVAVAIIVIGVVAFFILESLEENKNEIVVYGNVDVRLVDISFRVAGQVENVYVDEGDYISKGTLLATLKKDPYDSQVTEAKSKLEALLANLANAEEVFKRREALIGVGGVSKEEYDKANTQYQTLGDSVKQAEATLKVAEDQLSYTDAFAPTDGVILTRIREPGTVIPASGPVLTLSVQSPVWIRTFIEEPDLGVVYYGMPAKVFTDGGRVYDGKVGFISPLAEFTPKTVETTQLRTDLVYRLRIYVDNPDRQLVQGMPVTIKINKKHVRDASKD